MNSDYVCKGVRLTPDGKLVTADEMFAVMFNELSRREQLAALRQGYNPKEDEGLRPKKNKVTR